MDDVLVIGGGPAGLFSAWLARQRGARTRVVAAGIGTTHIMPGWLGVLEGEGSVEAAVRALVTQPPRSPLRPGRAERPDRRDCGAAGAVRAVRSALRRRAGPEHALPQRARRGLARRLRAGELRRGRPERAGADADRRSGRVAGFLPGVLRGEPGAAGLRRRTLRLRPARNSRRQVRQHLDRAGAAVRPAGGARAGRARRSRRT